MEVRVETTTAPRDEPMLRRLWLGDRVVELSELLDRWPGADHTYVKMLAETGAIFILRHDRLRDVWELILYQARVSD